MVFRAIAMKNTRNAVSKLRISRCQLSSTRFRDTRNAVSKLWVPRNFGEKYEKCRIQTAKFIIIIIIINCEICVADDISPDFVEIREMPPPNCGSRVANCVSRYFAEKYEKRRL